MRFSHMRKQNVAQLTRCRVGLFLASCNKKNVALCYSYKYSSHCDMHTAQHKYSWHITTPNQRVSEEWSHAGGAPLTKEPQCHRSNLKPQSSSHAELDSFRQGWSCTLFSSLSERAGLNATQSFCRFKQKLTLNIKTWASCGKSEKGSRFILIVHLLTLYK